MKTTSYDEAFTIEKHGDILVVVASPALERMAPGLSEGAAALVLEPLREAATPQLLVDLGRVQYIGSPVLAMLIRCWKTVSELGGAMALTGVAPAVRDLLKITKFDTLWPLYESRREAMDALLSD